MASATSSSPVVRLTPDFFARTVTQLRAIAARDVEVRLIGGGTVYVFGEELETLRLLKAYRECKLAKQGWSETSCSFYFGLELANMDGPPYVVRAGMPADRVEISSL